MGKGKIVDPGASGEVKKKDYRYLDEVNAVDLDEVVKIKEPMTNDEKVFVDIYIRMLLSKSEEVAKQEALKRAGYQFRFPQTEQLVADRILYKFEEKARDHKDIFRRLGAGETALAMELIKAVKGCVDEKAKAQLLNIWSKILGAQTTVAELGAGMELIIRRTKGEGLEPVESVLDLDAKAKAAEEKAPRKKGNIYRLTGDRAE